MRTLLTLAFGLAFSAAGYAADEVKLVSARGSDCPPVSGCYRSLFTEATIEVKNLAYAKQVNLVYLRSNGTWNSAPASYVGPSQSNKELWYVKTNEFTTQFAISYTVNGQTYWDNNGGAGIDYRFPAYQYDAILTYPEITDAQGYIVNPGDEGATTVPNDTTVDGNILVKNSGSGKIVNVVYTDNNWATVKNASASFAQALPSGVEYWSFQLPIAAGSNKSNIKIAFNYTYLPSGNVWDNNYGKDYRIVNNRIAR